MNDYTADWEKRLDLLLQEPLARAVRLVRRLFEDIQGGAAPDALLAAEDLAPSEIRALYWCVHHLEAGNEIGRMVAGRQVYDKANAKALSRAVADLPLEVDSYYREREALTPVLDEITTHYTQLADKEDPLAAGETLLTRITQAIASYGDIDQRGELADLRYKVRCHQASVSRRSGDYAAAEEWYRLAAECCLENNFSSELALVQLQRSEAYLAAGVSMDDVVRKTLPLWQAARSEPPSVPFLQLTILLARCYWTIGDHFEAKKYLQRAAEGQEGEEPASGEQVMRWLSAFPGPGGNSTQLLRYLYERAMLRLECAWLAANLAGEDSTEALEPHYELLRRLDAVHAGRVRADNALLAPFAEAGLYATSPPPILDFSRLLPLVDEIAEKGEKMVEQGEWPAAQQQFERAFRLAENMDYGETALWSLWNLMIARAMDDIAGFLSGALRGIEYVEEQRARLPMPYQRAAFLTNGRSVARQNFYSLGLLAAGRLGRPETVLQIGTLLKAEDPQTVKFADGNNEFAESLLEMRTNMDELDPTARKEQLEGRQRLYDSYMLGRSSAESRFREDAHRLAQDIRRGLPTNTVAIDYLNVDHQHLVITVLSAEEVFVHLQKERSPHFLSLLKEGALFPQAYTGTRGRSPRAIPGVDVSPTEDVPDWQELSDWLLPDAVWRYIEGVTHLIFCPHRQLHRLPFHALMKQGRYLVQSHTVRYVNNLLALTRSASPWQLNDIAIFACRDYQPYASVPLPSLPGALAEAEGIQAAYISADQRVDYNAGATCTRETMLARLDQWANNATPSVLHLAVHGEALPRDAPLDARLFLHDGSIDGFDLMVRELPFGLVVLSCCFAGDRAAGGRELDYAPGDELYGFQASLFAAGARRILGSLWEVEDRSGMEMMLAFHAELLAGRDPATALAHSMRQYLDTAPPERSSPVYWAPFFLTER
ncbi:CHAT domain-containing protein [Lewinella sp. IMCC34191]|uniref:CHAT domain-containing protein n=1 Tax=Lewinella sp. IMCC34191 TaxID=2259172 RepID=UPI001300214D|nr:CHAT domain-containing protein [Lewinella sp. IMCC34191]